MTIMKATTLRCSIMFSSMASAFILAAHSSPAQQSQVPLFTVGDYPGGAWTSGIEVTGFGLSAAIGGPGYGDSTVGQTFSIDNVTSALIDSIQVPIDGSSSATFQIGIAAWGGSQPVGSMLYLSSPLAGVDGWSTYTLTPNNLVLNQNQQYVLLATPNNFVDDGPAYNTGMGYVGGPTSGGQMYDVVGFEMSVNDLFNNSWTTANAAFAFDITYQAVPEPATPALLGLGALVVLGWRFRASRKSA